MTVPAPEPAGAAIDPPWNCCVHAPELTHTALAVGHPNAPRIHPALAYVDKILVGTKNVPADDDSA